MSYIMTNICNISIQFYFYYIYILLIIQIKNTNAYQCHICSINVIAHSASIDDLYPPSYDDCDIRTGTRSCYIRIHWLFDGTTEISYETNSLIPIESIHISIRRQVNFLTNEYSTRRSISYSCGSNRTSCNTISSLKRILSAIILPTDQQLHRLDKYIHPTKIFNGSLCSFKSNQSYCSIPNTIDCQQCIGNLVRYTNYSDLCSTCLINRTKGNFIDYDVIISLQTNFRSEKIKIVCQTQANCNSLENMNRIKEILTIEFNTKKFHRSTASKTISTSLTSFIIIYLYFISIC